MTVMESGPLGRTQLTVSRMGLGGNRLGGMPGTGRRRRAAALVEQALAAGVTTFDTADVYGAGTSEAVLGDVLHDVPNTVVATKVGYCFDDVSTVRGLARSSTRLVLHRGPGRYAEQDFSAAALAAAVDASCRRLRRDQLDVLQLHGPPVAVSTVLPEIIGQLRDSGRVRAFGVGCESLEVAASWLTVDGLDCVQLPYGVFDAQAASATIPEARRRGIGIIVRAALGGGLLGRYLRGEPTGLAPSRAAQLRRLDELAQRLGVELGQLAVWFARTSVPVDTVLLGAADPGQLAACVRWSTTPVPDPTVIEEARAIVTDESTT